MTFIDITPPVSPVTPVFPGDTQFHAERIWTIGGDTPVNVSKLTMSTHTGAHADAPLHYDPNGAAIDDVDVSAYIGPCAVVHMINDAALLTETMVRDAVARFAKKVPERILIRTYQRQPEIWDPGFTAMSAGAITWLAENGVNLIGIDTPSLDPASSKIMDAHRAIFTHNMRILEGLLLDHVDEGLYELIAPPLKLAGLDSSPVRALLRPIE